VTEEVRFPLYNSLDDIDACACSFRDICSVFLRQNPAVAFIIFCVTVYQRQWNQLQRVRLLETTSPALWIQHYWKDSQNCARKSRKIQWSVFKYCVLHNGVELDHKSSWVPQERTFQNCWSKTFTSWLPCQHWQEL